MKGTWLRGARVVALLVALLGGVACGPTPYQERLLTRIVQVRPDNCRDNPSCYWQQAEDMVPHNEAISVEAAEVKGLPGGKWASFNGSITTFGGRLYTTVRVDRRGDGRRNRACPDERSVSMVMLDANGQLQSKLQPLNLPEDTGCDCSEDARLVACNGAMYAVYNSEPFRAKKGSAPTVREYLAEIDASEPNALHATWVRRLESPYPAQQQEKNWTPFCHQGNLHFVLQTLPHVVAMLPPEQLWQAKNDICDEEICTTPLQLISCGPAAATDSNVVWYGGPWRGGTPAHYEPELGAYVSFFHSNLNRGRNRLYYAGFYTFDPAPPFAIRSYVPQPIAFPPISRRWHPFHRVVFPMGLVDQGNQYLVSYGQDDSSLGLASIDKQALFGELMDLP